MKLKKLKITDFRKINKFIKSMDEQTKLFFNPRFLNSWIIFLAYYLLGKLKGYYLVDNDKIVAYSSVDNLWGINNLAIIVAKEYRNRGIGRFMINKIIEDTKGNLNLTVNTLNEKAISLYNSMGFKLKYSCFQMEYQNDYK